MTIREMQVEHLAWEQHNFPSTMGQYNGPFKGIVEEVGELSHSLLKQEQGIRGTYEEHEKLAKDALGDMLVFMLSFCHAKGWDLQSIFEGTWNEVKKRDWIKFPFDGLTK